MGENRKYGRRKNFTAKRHEPARTGTNRRKNAPGKPGLYKYSGVKKNTQTPDFLRRAY